MILLTANTPILLATQPVDFRCGIDGFTALCRKHLAQDPRNGTLFIFINRRKTMLRGLVYDKNDFWLITKRLSCGCFPAWPTTAAAASPLLATQLRALLAAQPNWQQV